MIPTEDVISHFYIFLRDNDLKRENSILGLDRLAPDKKRAFKIFYTRLLILIWRRTLDHLPPERVQAIFESFMKRLRKSMTEQGNEDDYALISKDMARYHSILLKDHGLIELAGACVDLAAGKSPSRNKMIVPLVQHLLELLQEFSRMNGYELKPEGPARPQPAHHDEVHHTFDDIHEYQADPLEAPEPRHMAEEPEEKQAPPEAEDDFSLTYREFMDGVHGLRWGSSLKELDRGEVQSIRRAADSNLTLARRNNSVLYYVDNKLAQSKQCCDEDEYQKKLKQIRRKFLMDHSVGGSLHFSRESIRVRINTSKREIVILSQNMMRLLRKKTESKPGDPANPKGKSVVVPLNTVDRDTHSRLERFILDYLKAGGENNNLAHILSFYDDRVRYDEHGPVEKRFIADRLFSLQQLWPERVYALDGGVNVRSTDDPVVKEVHFSRRHYFTMDDRSESGKARVKMAVRITPDEPPVIVEEKTQDVGLAELESKA